MTDPVAAQYAAYPYPARDPADERRRLIVGSPSNLIEVDHYVFGGRRDWRQPFRALVAGGGTGDAAIMLAQQLSDAGTPAEVVHLDVSAPSQDVARARAEARGLTNLRFAAGSLLDVATLAPGPYDYIDCCGVLHHLPDPSAGVAALKAVLAPGGGTGLMVYGELGRTGVYHAQEMLRLVAPPGQPDDARLASAKRLLAGLPPTNWLRRNPQIRDHLEGGDAGIFDLLLHAQDRAYRVPELIELIAGAGLRPTGFVEPLRYDPAAYFEDEALRVAVSALDPVAGMAFAELLAGNMKTHVCYAVAADNPVPLPTPEADAVPVLRDMDPAVAARQLPAGGRVTLKEGGLPFSLDVPPLTPDIVALCNGQRSLREIHAALAQERPSLDWDAFLRQFTALYRVLNGVNRLLLRAG